MALSFGDQLDVATQAITGGDVDLLTRLFENPDSITTKDLKTVAERLGFKGPFLSAIVNTVADPVVFAGFLVSRSFPTLSWLTGAVPHRYVGAAANFGGLSSLVRPIAGHFRGTPIPKKERSQQP